MKIGEFFVELGATGGDQLKRTLRGVNDGLKQIRGTSLGTKAAIVGAAFAVERMTSFATKMGASYKEFAGYTGLSTKMLQKWQYAGRKANVTNDEIESSFLNVSRAMGDMLIGKGAPEGLAILSDTVGFDPSKAKNTLYVMKKLQEFATSFTGNEALKNKIIESFGIGSTAMISALKDNAFSRKKMAAAPVFSDREINKLAKMNSKMSEFYNNLKLSMGKLVVEFMPEIVTMMDKVSRSVKDIVFGFDSSSDAAIGFKAIIDGIWETIEMIAEGWGNIFSGVGKIKKEIDEKGVMGAAASLGSSAWDAMKDVGKGMMMDTPLESLVMPSGPSPSLRGGSNTQIKQEINFGSDQVDPSQIKKDFQGVMENTFRQMNQGAVN